MTEPLNDKQIDRLIADYLDGSLNETNRVAFENWLKASPNNPRRVARLSMTDYGMREVCQDTKADYLLDILNQIDAVSGPADLVTLHTIEPSSWHRYRVHAIWGAIAAVMLIAVTIFFVFQGSTPPTNTSPIVESPPSPTIAPQQSVVATLTATHNATWAERDLTRGSQLHAGDRLTLTAGFAEITTNDGAVAIIEAPATIELIDNANALLLHTGKLVGFCETESSKGFLVRTPHMDVTDLGTRFGVSVNEQGGLKTAVFEGKVMVNPSNDLQDQIAGVLVKAGQAVDANSTGAVDLVPYQLKPDHGFLPTWRDINGRVQITGQARFFVDPPADISPNALIDPDHMIVFQEQTAQTESPISVMTELSAAAPSPTHAQIPAGTRVISYMVHFSPAKFVPHVEGEPKNNASMTTAKAEIVFPGRVLGVIGESEAMAATHELLGLESVIYLDPNDKEYNNAIDDWPGDSFKIIGEGQNTLEIKLSAIVHSDQARVLVEMPAD